MNFQFDRVYPQGPVAPTSSKLRTDLVKADEFQSSYVDRSQSVVVLGDTIPVVFCKRGSTGGVFVSPPAVRMNYSRTCKTITTGVACVVSDGQCPAIATADVWLGAKKGIPSAQTNYGSVSSLTPGGTISISEMTYTETTRYTTNATSSGVPTSADSSDRFYLYGSGSITVQSKTDRCRSFTASISGTYLLQGSGNGLDGFPSAMSGKSYKGTAAAPDPDNMRSFARISPRFFTSAKVSAAIGWDKKTVKTPNPDFTFCDQYEVTFSNPKRSMGLLYPPNEVFTIPASPTQSNYDTWLNNAYFFADDSVRSVDFSSYTAERDEKYIGGGTSLAVVTDSFVVNVTETNEYDCPLPSGLPQTGGSGGSFERLTTLSISHTTDIEEGLYAKQVHAFVRDGVIVDRLIEGSAGSSNQFPDLVRYFMTRCARVPDALIDDARLRSAAEFCAAQGLWFDGVINTNANLREWITQVAPFYLLQMTQVDGRFGLKPAVPVSGTSISTDSVTPVMEFTNADVIAGSYTRTSVDAADLRPFAALMLWREQPDNGPGMVKTTEVRYTGSAPDGPFETYDGSEFITSEAHAIKAGRFFLAQRRHVTHTATWQTSVQGSMLNPGDVVRMTLTTESSTEGAGSFSELYQIDVIEETLGGLTTIRARFFPVDSQGRSLVALDVTGGSFS
jgi:hypothetical protein